MKILVLSNFYPPHAVGGMEHRCQEVVSGLRQRGHEVIVLTSSYKAFPDARPDAGGEEAVYRRLHLESDLTGYRPLDFFSSWRRKERQNLGWMKSLVRRFAPDVVFVWGMWNLSRQLPGYAERALPGRVVYSLAQNWPREPGIHQEYWQNPARRAWIQPLKKAGSRLALRLLAQEQEHIHLAFRHAIMVSQALKDELLQAGLPLENARVVYPGIDLNQFQNPGPRPGRAPGEGLALLYAGALGPHKGVHTAVEAMQILAQDGPDLKATLCIVGKGHPDYTSRLKKMVFRAHLEERVRFIEWIPREKMPGLLGGFDALVFPSFWEEPFSRAILEAMAAGLVVIATPTGGTKELIRDERNGLVFPPGDAQALAVQIHRLSQDNRLGESIRACAAQEVRERFSLDRMVDEIECYLSKAAAGELLPIASPAGSRTVLMDP